MSATVVTSPNKIQICQVLVLTKNIENLSADVNDLIKIVTAHGQEIRSLVDALNSKCSKAELFAAISTAKLQNLKGFPPSDALLNIMGENQKFTPIDHSVINELDHNKSQSSHPATQSTLTDSKTNTKITKLENEIKFLKAQLNEMELNNGDKYCQQDKKILKLIETQKNFIKNNSASMRLRKLRENNENDDMDPYSSNISIHSRGSFNESNLDHFKNSYRPPRGGILISEDDPEADYYSDRQIGVRLEDLTQSIDLTLTSLHHPERHRSNSLSQHHHQENPKVSSQHPELIIDNNSGHVVEEGEEFPEEMTPRSNRTSIHEKRKSINNKSPKSRRGSIVKIKTRRASITSQTSVHSTQKSVVTPNGSRRQSQTQPLKPFVFGGTGALALSNSGALALPPIKSHKKTTSVSSASNDDSEYHSDFYQYDAITSETTRQKKRKQKQVQKQPQPPQSSNHSSDDDNGDLLKAIFRAVSAVSELENSENESRVSSLRKQTEDDVDDDDVPKTLKSKMNLSEKSETAKYELLANDDELSTNSFVNRNESSINYQSSDINTSMASTSTKALPETSNKKDSENHHDNVDNLIQISNAAIITEEISVSKNSEVVSANNQHPQIINQVETNVITPMTSIPVTPVANNNTLENHKVIANNNELIKGILKNDGNNSIDSPNKNVSISNVLHTSIPPIAENTDNAKTTDSSAMHPSNSPEIALSVIASPRPLSRTGNIVSDDVTVRQQVTLPVNTVTPAGSGAGASPLQVASSLASPMTTNQSIESVISTLLGITVKPSRDREDQDAYLSALIRQISSVSNPGEAEDKSPNIIEKTFSDTDAYGIRRALSDLSITDESPVPQRTESSGKNKQNLTETQPPNVIVPATTTTAPMTTNTTTTSTRDRTFTEVSVTTKDKDPEPAVHIDRTTAISRQNKKDSNRKLGNSSSTIAAATAAVSTSIGLNKQSFDAITQLIRTIVDEKMSILMKKQKEFETKQFQSNQHISHVVDSVKKLRDELASLAKSNRQSTDKVERAYIDLTSTITKLELLTDSCKIGLERVDQSCSKREKKLANYIDRNLSRMRLETPRFTRDGARSNSISPNRASPMDYQRPSAITNHVTSTPLKTISFEHGGLTYISEVPLGGNNANSLEDLSVISMRGGGTSLRAKPSRNISPSKVIRVTSLTPSLSRQGGLYQGILSTSANTTGYNSSNNNNGLIDKKLLDSPVSQSSQLSPPYPFSTSTVGGSSYYSQAKQQPVNPLYITPAPKTYSRKGSFLNASAAAAGETTFTSHNAVNDTLDGNPTTNQEDVTTNMQYPRSGLQSHWEPHSNAVNGDASIANDLRDLTDPSVAAAAASDYASFLNGEMSSRRNKMGSALDLGSPTPAVPAAPQPTSFSPRNPSFIRVTKITLSRQNSANINISAPQSVSSSEVVSLSGRPPLIDGELSDLSKDMNTEMKFPNVVLDIPSPSRDTSPLLIRSRAGSFAIQNLPVGISRQNSRDSSSKGDNMFPIRAAVTMIRSTSPRSPILLLPPPTPSYTNNGGGEEEEGNHGIGLASIGDSHICMTPPISAIPSRSALSPPHPHPQGGYHHHPPSQYSNSTSGINNNITFAGGTKEEINHAIKVPIKRVLGNGGIIDRSSPPRNYSKMLPSESTTAPLLLPLPSPRTNVHRNTTSENKRSTSGDNNSKRRKDSASTGGVNGRSSNNSNNNTPVPPKTEYNASWSVQKHQKILLQQLETIRKARAQSGAAPHNPLSDTTKSTSQLDSKIEGNHFTNTTDIEYNQQNPPPKENNIVLL